jgi:hypothetical protein
VKLAKAFSPLSNFIYPDDALTLKTVFDNIRNAGLGVLVLYAAVAARDSHFALYLVGREIELVRNVESNLLLFMGYTFLTLNILQSMTIGFKAVTLMPPVSKDIPWWVGIPVTTVGFVCSLACAGLGFLQVMIIVYSVQSGLR